MTKTGFIHYFLRLKMSKIVFVFGMQKKYPKSIQKLLNE